MPRTIYSVGLSNTPSSVCEVCTLHAANIKLHTTQLTLLIAHHTLHTTQLYFTLHTSNFPLHSTHLTLYFTKFTLHILKYTSHCTLHLYLLNILVLYKCFAGATVSLTSTTFTLPAQTEDIVHLKGRLLSNRV